MGKTIQVAQTVTEVSETGSIITLATDPPAGTTITDKELHEGEVPVAGTKTITFTPALAVAGFSLLILPQAGAGDDFEVVVTLTAGLAQAAIRPAVNSDGSIQLTIHGGYGIFAATDTVASIAISDKTAVHPNTTKFSLDVWKA